MERHDWNARLAALRSGDMAAFEEIYEELKTPAYTVILRILRDESLAEDVLQEVFVKLYLSPPPENVRSPRAYLLQTAHNLAIDCERRQRPAVPFEEVEATARSGERDVELKLDLENAIATLPAVDSQIVTLHLNGGLPFREVARILRLPLGTALWRYHRAIARLRFLLTGGAV